MGIFGELLLPTWNITWLSISQKPLTLTSILFDLQGVSHLGFFFFPLFNLDSVLLITSGHISILTGDLEIDKGLCF